MWPQELAAGYERWNDMAGGHKLTEADGPKSEETSGGSEEVAVGRCRGNR